MPCSMDPTLAPVAPCTLAASPDSRAHSAPVLRLQADVVQDSIYGSWIRIQAPIWIQIQAFSHSYSINFEIKVIPICFYSFKNYRV